MVGELSVVRPHLLDEELGVCATDEHVDGAGEHTATRRPKVAVEVGHPCGNSSVASHAAGSFTSTATVK
jgi:hypothetical protein